MIVSVEGHEIGIKSLFPTYFITLVVAITHVISPSEARHNIFAAIAGNGDEDSTSNHHSRMSSSPLWPSSEAHWADVPTGSSDGWSSWGAKKYPEENNARVGGGTMAMQEPRHAPSATSIESSGYVSGETKSGHSGQITSAFTHNPFENSDLASTKSFVGGHFDSFRQSLQREAAETQPSRNIGLTESLHHFEAAKGPYDRQGEAPESTFGQDFYSSFNSPNGRLGTVIDDKDHNTGFLPSSQPSNHGVLVHATLQGQSRIEREGSDDSTRGVKYNINHGDFGNSYFASAGAEKKLPHSLDSHDQRFDHGGLNGKNTDRGYIRYSPELLNEDLKDEQTEHNFDLLRETKQEEGNAHLTHPVTIDPSSLAEEDHHAQRNREFTVEETGYVPVDYRHPIQKLEHVSTSAVESATNRHSLRLAAPPRVGAAPSHGHHHSSHDVHPHDGPFHFSEPPVEGTANEEYRRHAAEHTSFMTKEEQKELDEAFARLKERRQNQAPTRTAQASPTSRFSRDFSWF